LKRSIGLSVLGGLKNCESTPTEEFGSADAPTPRKPIETLNEVTVQLDQNLAPRHGAYGNAYVRRRAR
jgi:hypothetical protein